MEPMNCVVKLSDDRCDVWNGEQFQTVDQGSVAKTVGLTPQQVFLHQLFAGGSFGRRANPQSDYLVEAASIAKSLAAMGKGGAPIKLVWTREDDMKSGLFSSDVFSRDEGRIGFPAMSSAGSNRSSVNRS